MFLIFAHIALVLFLIICSFPFLLFAFPVFLTISAFSYFLVFEKYFTKYSLSFQHFLRVPLSPITAFNIVRLHFTQLSEAIYGYQYRHGLIRMYDHFMSKVFPQKSRKRRFNIPYHPRHGKYADIYLSSGTIKREAFQKNPTSSTNSSFYKQTSFRPTPCYCSGSIPKPTYQKSGDPVIILICATNWRDSSPFACFPLAERLQKEGMVVFVPDITNYPEGNIRAMMEDVSQSIWWVEKNISQYGGDPQQIHLLAYSAGAHVCALTLLHDAIRTSSLRGISFEEHYGQIHPSRAPLPRIQSMILFSGIYDLHYHNVCEHVLGLNAFSVLHEVMSNTSIPSAENLASIEELNLTSPAIILTKAIGKVDIPTIRKRLPVQVLLLHGTEDTCSPPFFSEFFAQALRKVGMDNVNLVLEKTPHLNPISAIQSRHSPLSHTLLLHIKKVVAGRYAKLSFENSFQERHSFSTYWKWISNSCNSILHSPE